MNEYVTPKKSTRELETGSWASKKPNVDNEKCTKCKTCVKFCPEACIILKENIEVDLKHCKGCGICANICPVKAIEMRDV